MEYYFEIKYNNHRVCGIIQANNTKEAEQWIRKTYYHCEIIFLEYTSEMKKGVIKDCKTE
jgi:hypothetical protein